MAYTTLKLTPTAKYKQYSWDGDTDWTLDEDERTYLDNETLLQMPGVYVTPEEITSIALNLSGVHFSENEEAGNRAFNVGITNELCQPTELTRCIAYVAENVTSIEFVITPTVDITGDWYIYIHDVEEYQSTTVAIDSVTLTHYVAATACGAPTECWLSETLTVFQATLSWDGATPGIGNHVSGYEVQRSESADCVEWGEWETVATTTASSIDVTPPEAAGGYYKFRVRALGSAGEEFHSAWKECDDALRRDHVELEGFTDAELVAGETHIKAIHMLELQDRVATLRSFYNLSEYRFTAITAGETSLAGWTDHVLEIREAIDEMTQTHDTWLAITENKPRVDVMMQLRDVILKM